MAEHPAEGLGMLPGDVNAQIPPELIPQLARPAALSVSARHCFRQPINRYDPP
ncbi:MAG TPA: hypothetical protein VGY55_17545 [Pirellulales bacterium]|nr:hypothetical protein [Pirellulales bacterium]